MASKTDTTKATEAAKATAKVQKEPTFTLAEWCAQRSHRLGRGIEVLSGFQFVEKKTLEKLPDAEWESKFQAFLKMPA